MEEQLGIHNQEHGPINMLSGSVCMGMLLVGGIHWQYILTISGIVAAMALLFLGMILYAPSTFSRGETWRNRILGHTEMSISGEELVTSNGDYQIELAQIAIFRG